MGVGIMDQPGIQISAFDCDIIRSAFIKSVLEQNIPDDQWRAKATLLITEFMGSADIEPELLEWIVRK